MIMRFINVKIIFLLLLFLCRYDANAVSPVRFTDSDLSTIGILIKDLKTGKILADHNSRQLMVPASTMKFVTVAAAMRQSGTTSRYETGVSLYGDYSEADSLFSGAIVINPSGDPTLNNPKIEDNDSFIKFIINILKSKSICHFKGEIIVEGENVPQQGQIPTWEIEDAAYGYGSGWFIFNYNDNNVRYNINTGITDPSASFLVFEHQRSDAPFEVVHGVESETYTLYGNIPESANRWLTVPLPWPATLFFEQMLTALDESGITFENFEPDNYKALPLFSSNVWSSCERGEIYKYLMCHSDNMMAESTLRALCPYETRDSALVLEKQIIKELGVNTNGMRIFDGSGLTRKNGVSPLFLSDVLGAMAKTDYADEYASYFPVAGMDGTMRSFNFKSLKKNRLALKTGTVNGVRCYAGYLIDRNGTPLCSVVVMLNHITCNVSEAKAAVEKYISGILKSY